MKYNFKSLKNIKKENNLMDYDKLREIALEHFLHLDALKHGRVPGTSNFGSEPSWYWIDGQMNWIFYFFNLDKKYKELLG